jgi:hypothetical protein
MLSKNVSPAALAVFSKWEEFVVSAACKWEERAWFCEGRYSESGAVGVPIRLQVTDSFPLH